MTAPGRTAGSRGLVAAVVCSGLGGLLWEVLWQQRAALALGASAFGAAITLASMMLGFALGAAWVARAARRRRLGAALAAYGAAELVVAAGGLLVAPGLDAVAALDTHLWAVSPTLATAAQLLGTAALVVVPSTAMGATIPLLAACATRTSLPTLYALNTAGAAIGILIGTFALVPALGLTRTGLVAAALELGVALWALRQPRVAAIAEATAAAIVPASRAAIAFGSGLATFLLEVAWFRSVRAAYQSSTETFGVLLAAFLLPLALGAALAPRLRRRVPDALPLVVALAAAAALCATPAVDQLDEHALVGPVALLPAWRLLQLLLWIGPAVVLLGAVFPWLLDERPGAIGGGTLYAANTAGAVIGALGAGFVLLPTIGATRTAWIAAGTLALLGVAIARGARTRAAVVALAALGLGVAVRLDGGAGRTRVQGAASPRWGRPIYVAEGPDATVSIAEEAGGVRDLVIDGFEASSDSKEAHYMRWMGHLPALAAARLDRALVICFGTGQTANAVRRHRPRALDVVDVSAAVLRGGRLFPVNEGVLDDPSVRATVMDGRAFLRRARDRAYDLVTLEPMPPNFAGVNALYAREFYALVRARLAPGGVAAQWLPIHLVSPAHMAAIVATFVEAFPHSRLWIDPVEGTGILVGGARPWRFRPADVALDLDDAAIARAVLLDEEALAAVAALGTVITDDNQLLSYGHDRLRRYRFAGVGQGLADANRGVLGRIAAQPR